MSASSDEPLVLTVQYQPTFADLIAYFRHLRWSEPAARRRVLLLWLLLAVLVSTPVALDPGTILVIGLRGVFILLLLLAASGLLLIWMAVSVLPWWLASNCRDERGALAPGTLTVSPEGLFGTAEGQEFRCGWDLLEDIVTTRDHLFFRLGAEHALVVPRRAFGSPAAAEKFFAVAREYRNAAGAAPPRAVPAVDVADALGPERIAVDYELTAEDVARFQRFHILRNPKTLRTLVIHALLIAVVGSFVWKSGISLAAAVLYIILPLWVMPWVTRRQLRKHLATHGRHSFALSPAGLWTTSTALGEGRVEWSAITEVVANEHMVMLYRNEQNAYIIPRRAFATPQEAEAFLLRATEWHATAMAGAASPAAADKMG